MATSYPQGNSVEIASPLFGGASPYDPDSVDFEVQLPDNTVQTFTFGSDAAVTNPATGLFELAFGAPSEVGEYRWRVIGLSTGNEETFYGTFFVVPSAVDPPGSTPPGPMLGPCQTWITGEDVAACPNVNQDYGSNVEVFDLVAYEASMALFEISGRQFTGLCGPVEVRPTRQSCGCWGAPSSEGFGPWAWTGSAWGYGAASGWYNECGDKFGCAPMSRVKLAGYAREITEVRIAGVALPEFDPDTGYRNWRLDQWRYLTRMDDPSNTFDVKRFWPGCQDMSLDADVIGSNTFSVSYKYGIDPPALARAAAIEIAWQLWVVCNGGKCQLPAGVQKVTRQGVEIERGLLANWFDPKKPTGLVATDLFLKSYNPNRARRRGAVWSPDMQQYARRLG